MSWMTRWFGGGRRADEDLLRSLLVMAWMVEARDPYTGGHLWRVAQMVRILATDAGLPPDEVARATVGGFLHDLGKVAVSDAVLRKPSELDEAEYAEIKSHPDAGWRMLAGHPLASLAEAGVRCHHERPDGKGYPRGLSGSEIPRDALMIAIADAFDAMTSTRPYRAGMPIGNALDIIEDNLGSQFDDGWGRRFVRLGRARAFDHIVGHSDDGMPLQECPKCPPGPVLAIRREQREGEAVYCRACGGEFRLGATGPDGVVQLDFQGKADPANLAPQVDVSLIERFVADSARSLSSGLR